MSVLIMLVTLTSFAAEDITVPPSVDTPDIPKLVSIPTYDSLDESDDTDSGTSDTTNSSSAGSATNDTEEPDDLEEASVNEEVIEPTVTLVQGIAKAAISDEAIGKAIEAIKTSDGGANEVTISIKTKDNPDKIEAKVSVKAMEKIAENKKASLVLDTPMASIAFDSASVLQLSEEGSSDISISVEAKDVADLSEEARTAIKDRPVYEFNVKSNDQSIHEFKGRVTVSLPYTLLEGEDPDAVVIYYIKEDGTLEMVKNCRFDAITNKVIFKTKHFSAYSIGYHKVEFADVSGWYSDYVDYLASRGIVAGVSEDNFNPDGTLKRSELIQIMYNLSGETYTLSEEMVFMDVERQSWYAEAAGWAKDRGIITGHNNYFYPNQAITREDVAVIIVRYMRLVDGMESEVKTAETFTDQLEISDYAIESVEHLAEADIIGGYPDGSFGPKANAKRLEIAKIIAVWQQK